jgi:choline kinase
MKAVILAAGRGSRMGNATDDSPKCLFQYKGRPLVEHVVNNLTNFVNFDDIYLISGYQSHKLDYLGLHTFVNRMWDRTNIMGSLLQADSILVENETIITYSDIYYEPAAIARLIECRAPAVVSTENWSEVWHKRFKNPLEDLETFSIDSEGFLVDIGGRVEDLVKVMGQFGGVYSLNPKSWEWLKSNVVNFSNKDTTSTLNELIKHSPYRIEVAKYQEAWAEIDSLSDAIAQT